VPSVSTEGRKNSIVVAPQALKILRTVAVVESAESSNRVEGIVARPDRIRDLVLEDASPRDRSEQEIAGYCDALALIHESAEHMPFTVNVIRQVHQALYRYLPTDGGRWRSRSSDNPTRHPGNRMTQTVRKEFP